MKKYEITTETIIYKGKTLHRIRALRDFANVKKGDFGGFVEKESNLSHDGDCWIYGDAMVYGNADVYGNAEVRDDARVYGNAEVHGSADVYGSALVCGSADIRNFRDVFFSCGLGEEGHGTTFFRTKSGEIAVKSGCFFGSTLKEFKDRVKSSRKGVIKREYLSLLETAKIHFEVED